MPVMRRVVNALGVVTLVAVGTRVCWWLIEPVLSALIVLLVVVWLLAGIVAGPRYRSGRERWM